VPHTVLNASNSEDCPSDNWTRQAMYV